MSLPFTAVHTKPNHCLQADRKVKPTQTALQFHRMCPRAQASAETSAYLVLALALLLLLLAGPMADDMMLGWEACRTSRAA